MNKKEHIISDIPSYDGPGVYTLTDVDTGEMYIGSSVNVSSRIAWHDCALRRGRGSRKMKSAVQSGHRFTASILEVIPYGVNYFYLFSRESHYIQKYDTIEKGYNTAKTTACTKEELLEEISKCKKPCGMTDYLRRIIEKREQVILPPKNRKMQKETE